MRLHITESVDGLCVCVCSLLIFDQAFSAATDNRHTSNAQTFSSFMVQHIPFPSTHTQRTHKHTERQGPKPPLSHAPRRHSTALCQLSPLLQVSRGFSPFSGVAILKTNCSLSSQSKLCRRPSLPAPPCLSYLCLCQPHTHPQKAGHATPPVYTTQALRHASKVAFCSGLWFDACSSHSHTTHSATQIECSLVPLLCRTPFQPEAKPSHPLHPTHPTPRPVAVAGMDFSRPAAVHTHKRLTWAFVCSVEGVWR